MCGFISLLCSHFFSKALVLVMLGCLILKSFGMNFKTCNKIKNHEHYLVEALNPFTICFYFNVISFKKMKLLVTITVNMPFLNDPVFQLITLGGSATFEAQKSWARDTQIKKHKHPHKHFLKM